MENEGQCNTYYEQHEEIGPFIIQKAVIFT